MAILTNSMEYLDFGQSPLRPPNQSMIPPFYAQVHSHLHTSTLTHHLIYGVFEKKKKNRKQNVIFMVLDHKSAKV